MDDKVEFLEFAFVARTHLLVLVNDYLTFKTGGPIFGDLLEMWLEYGGVVAACLVRKPAAGTIALTINGIFQVFVNGTHDPHLLYGVPGFGADMVFASLRYKRYDVPAVCLAGVACSVFWYPIVWFTHGIYLYPVSFILSDLAVRMVGSAVGDGLLAGGVALLVLRLAGRRWNSPRAPAFRLGGWNLKDVNAAGLLIISLGVLLIVLTHGFLSVSNFFVGIGPKIPPGIPAEEEYNPGYVIGILPIFLALAVLAFSNLRSLYSDEEASRAEGLPSSNARPHSGKR